MEMIGFFGFVLLKTAGLKCGGMQVNSWVALLLTTVTVFCEVFHNF